jgi:YbgC/YbaW family acyl-CoA thioester hydrolase
MRAKLVVMSAPANAFEVREHVRWSDVDAASIICYGAYIRFFEIAETELFRRLGMPYGEVFERFDFWLPRASMHFEFRAPARLDDELVVRLWIDHIGVSSMKLQCEMARTLDGTLTAEGYVVLVAVDRVNLTPQPIPPALVEALQPYRTPLDTVVAGVGGVD